MNSLLEKTSRYRISIFLFLCIILGGTSQPIYTPKIVLYVLSALSIGVCLLQNPYQKYLTNAKLLMVITTLFIAYSLVQIIPLPANIWGALPGRELITQSYELMEIKKPWLPIAMVPGDVLKSLLGLLPALALFMMTLRAQKEDISLAIWTLIIGAFISLSLGLFQILTEMEAFYPYDITNSTNAVGLFSNINHQATLMAIVSAFTVSTILIHNRKERLHSRLKFVLSALLTMAFMLTLLLNSSSAGFILMVILIAAIGLFFFVLGKQSYRPFTIGFVCIILAIILIDFFFLGNAQKNFMHSLTDDGTTSRQEIFATTWSIFKNNSIFGSGLGSFAEVYASYEDIKNVTNSYVNHAHNDYLEIIMELGVLGLGLVIGHVIWWIRSVAILVKNHSELSYYAKAGAITLLIIFAHSFVDYPLRTLTISSIAGLSAGLVQRGANIIKIGET